MLTVSVPLAVRQRGGRKLVVTPGTMLNRGPSGADITLAKALARAFRRRRLMETGRYGTLNELAAAEKLNSSCVSRLLRLTLLAPDIVEAILVERQPARMTLPGRWSRFRWSGIDRKAIRRRHPLRASSSRVASAYDDVE